MDPGQKPRAAEGPSDEGAGGRLLYRCRRGMKELDVLLERFARRFLAQAPAGERRAFERLLNLPDPLLAAYLLGETRPVDRELRELTARIRDVDHGSAQC